MDTKALQSASNTQYRVNGEMIEFGDRQITAREALNKAHLTPATEYQLILVRDGRTKLVPTDEDIDLKKEAGGFLRAFRSDRAFAFTVEEIGQVWGDEVMDVDEFLSIWSAPPDRDWVLEREDQPDVILRSGGTLAFGPKGVEDIVSRPHHGAEKITVAVFTTSGTFPAQGVLRVKTSTVISDVLVQAAASLSLADTSGWVVSVNGQTVNQSQTFEQAGLHGDVELEWGAPEGGGGDA
ncbi:hypothetical protein HFO33_34270 [Rhizobium leguminosarum]|uniref:multiubiquitin domain-containing protein n=1 Tax=Rhizobium leguminosarum TaxID=384 RepID=UPI001C95C8CE|nr:multiubiquitin domain-containing protein [Rhizobium leguminosarum]MBY5667382.1 hypothetical protein [Rhizobium leguminosarum]MBY5710111.1 hypothetical protein [Rhizobium leguminosarum]MBY5721564.1 hypothetical protein [Rhizobium leguminosarum]